MAKFIFDCDDEICLPAAYNLVDEVQEYIEKMKTVEVNEDKARGDNKTVLKKVLRNMMVKYPKETGRLFAKFWVLDNGEKAPNIFRTMSTLFSNEVAIDFFTSVFPALLQVSKQLSPLLISKK